MNIDYNETIPNNVDLADDRRLLRALERWQPAYLKWWEELGPVESGNLDIYLRTAISVERDGWANYGHVRMPEYRWGIFLAPPEANREIGFGMHKGEPVWQSVPGEYRSELRRLIVTQGDTEPASVEQQRHLGKTCPSLYDLRNLFQVNVEEGRHLWAMVYLLHAHFGRDGREEADLMLLRHAGDPDRPRILEAFNEKTDDWLSFFMFTYFQDRDGKFQLASLAESGFDPLSRTCRFMLTEEAHHMFVGETGISRIIERSCALMREHDTDDLSSVGGIGLPIMQRFMNFHFSICLDLFGQEKSTNAANYFTMGLKGRFQESRIDDDHKLDGALYSVPAVENGRIVSHEIAAITASNERLREDFTLDSQRGVNRFNKIVAEHRIDFEFTLPHAAFNRGIGAFAAINASPAGEIIDDAQWNRRHGEWLPTDADKEYVNSLMTPVIEPGRMASWIAPPRRGIHGQPLDYDYVRFH
ncbi:MAG: Benzoyl-CoA oxygenase component B [Alphaproteobacteria bacterium MarineAlpha10_Bin3]|nr:MAG: Benzoyl-CoA oxygenase component B [Alphaproteobacteria bacterium MarineAlpha10_Bin3]PPR74105.1 MAG: Benzoyl-CoA oxygenase component B [Alphaproteobacteria bacterium MarineAlpha4_Bin1]